MFDPIFENLLAPVEMTAALAGICALTSLLMGSLTGLVHRFRNSSNGNFILTLSIMPFIVQCIIMVVNGNVGTGIAVMGAFTLVRFRSVPGTAREIASIFLSMAIGLLTGAGHYLFAILFTLIANGFIVLFVAFRLGSSSGGTRFLTIAIPEDLDYTSAFDDIFAEYCRSAMLEQARTANLGTLFELRYTVTMKDLKREKEFLDKIRMRNSNLYIHCSRTNAYSSDTL
jgi:uncharacterized membrane protein YhiD involved in acid resistance